MTELDDAESVEDVMVDVPVNCVEVLFEFVDVPVDCVEEERLIELPVELEVVLSVLETADDDDVVAVELLSELVVLSVLVVEGLAETVTVGRTGPDPDAEPELALAPDASRTMATSPVEGDRLLAELLK